MTLRVDDVPVPTDAVTASATDRGATASRSVTLVTLTTVVIGVSNYVMSVAVVRLLPAGQFTQFAAVQGLLLVLGTGSLAAVPWAVARHLTTHPDAEGRSNGLHFGLVTSAWQGAAFAVVATVVGAELGGATLAVAAGLAAFSICMVSAPIGYFQGLSQFPVLITLRLVETGVRIAAGLGLAVLVAGRADLVVLGFPIAAASAVAFGLTRARSAFPLRPMAGPARRRLLQQAAVLGLVQALLAALAALDTVYAGLAAFDVTAGAAYQAASLLARVPLFFGSAVSITAFTAMVAARDDRGVGRILRGCVRSYAWLCVAFLAGALTVPADVLHLVIPAQYADAPMLLRVLAVGGVAVGAINVVTTAHQARLAYRRCVVVLVAATAVQAALLLALGQVSSVLTFAVAVSTLAVVALVAVALDASRWLGRPHVSVPRPAWLLVPLVALLLVREPVVWCAAAAATSAICARLALRAPSSDVVTVVTSPVEQ